MVFGLIVILSLTIFLLVAFIYRSNVLLLCLIFVAYSLYLRIFVVPCYSIMSDSMLPTLLPGDQVLTDKYVYSFAEPQRGDLVIFPDPRNPEQYIIKRVIAVGGETIEIKGKQVYINSDLLTEPYKIQSNKEIFPAQNSPRDNYPPFTVPDDSLFVMGDNRDNSYDSRFWGAIRKQAVIEKVLSVYWSWDKSKGIVRWDRFGELRG